MRGWDVGWDTESPTPLTRRIRADLSPRERLSKGRKRPLLLFEPEGRVVDDLAFRLPAAKRQAQNDLGRSALDRQSVEGPEAEAALVVGIADEDEAVTGLLQRLDGRLHQRAADAPALPIGQHRQRADQEPPGLPAHLRPGEGDVADDPAFVLGHQRKRQGICRP